MIWEICYSKRNHLHPDGTQTVKRKRVKLVVVITAVVVVVAPDTTAHAQPVCAYIVCIR